MTHDIIKTLSDGAFKAVCSCGWDISCSAKKFRECQVENHIASVTGYRPEYCKRCWVQVGSIQEPSVRIDIKFCNECTSMLTGNSVSVRYGE